MQGREQRSTRLRALELVMRHKEHLLDQLAREAVDREDDFSTPFGNADDLLERYQRALQASEYVRHHLGSSLHPCRAPVCRATELRETKAGLQEDLNSFLRENPRITVVSVSYTTDFEGRACMVTYQEPRPFS